MWLELKCISIRRTRNDVDLGWVNMSAYSRCC